MRGTRVRPRPDGSGGPTSASALSAGSAREAATGTRLPGLGGSACREASRAEGAWAPGCLWALLLRSPARFLSALCSVSVPAVILGQSQTPSRPAHRLQKRSKGELLQAGKVFAFTRRVLQRTAHCVCLQACAPAAVAAEARARQAVISHCPREGPALTSGPGVLVAGTQDVGCVSSGSLCAPGKFCDDTWAKVLWQPCGIQVPETCNWRRIGNGQEAADAVEPGSCCPQFLHLPKSGWSATFRIRPRSYCPQFLNLSHLGGPLC